MEAGALRVARAARHGWHDIWEESRTEVIGAPFLIVEVVQCLKIHGGVLHGRPVVPVHGSSQLQSLPVNNVLVGFAMVLAHLIQWVVGAT